MVRVGVISGRIPERYFPPPFYSLPPGEGIVTFYEAVNIVYLLFIILVMPLVGFLLLYLRYRGGKDSSFTGK